MYESSVELYATCVRERSVAWVTEGWKEASRSVV